MKDICTFETAKALKDAGFPQPEPEAGQVWYARHETFIFLGRISSGAWTVCSVDYDEVQNIYPNDMVFAPTATDLLLDLPEDTHLYVADVDGERFFVPSLFEFVENETIKYDDGLMAGWDISEPDTNPAEACAAAWLALSKAQ